MKYFVDDLPGARIPSSRLWNIIETLEQKRELKDHALAYLRQQGLLALCTFATGSTTYEAFCESAAAEQTLRKHLAEIAAQTQLLEQKAREAAMFARLEADRRARENDPKFLAKMKNRALRQRYGIDQFVEEEDFSRLMTILRRLDEGIRLTDDDQLWLQTKGKGYCSVELRNAFHNREAEYFAQEYTRTQDPWNAVNASGHYRKCEKPEMASNLLLSVSAKRQHTKKLKSAIATTHGGAMRDLKRLNEALLLGEQAHSLTPDDFRPCTLLGAVNFELGNYDIGQDWYAKATARGAPESSIDSDLRGILLRVDATKFKEIKAYLLREDPVRYKWVNKLKSGETRRTP